MQDNDTHFVLSKVISIIPEAAAGPVLNERDVSDIRSFPPENQEVLTAFRLSSNKLLGVSYEVNK